MHTKYFGRCMWKRATSAKSLNSLNFLPCVIPGWKLLLQWSYLLLTSAHSCGNACSSQPSCSRTTAENVFQEKRLLVADSHPSRAVGTAVRQHASLWQFWEGVLDAYSSYYYLSSVHLFFFLYTVHILISLPQLFLYCILQRNFPRLPLLFARYPMGLHALGCPLLL